jgi:hypothetical protein
MMEDIYDLWYVPPDLRKEAEVFCRCDWQRFIRWGRRGRSPDL